jgi:Flp pilus assembly protein TadB
MLGILFFVVILAALGFYIWRDHNKAKAAREMAKLDAAVKAQAENLAKKIP